MIFLAGVMVSGFIYILSHQIKNVFFNNTLHGSSEVSVAIAKLANTRNITLINKSGTKLHLKAYNYFSAHSK